LLAAPIIFTFAVRQPYALRNSTMGATPGARAIAVVSIGLWLSVAIAGRMIGFL